MSAMHADLSAMLAHFQLLRPLWLLALLPAVALALLLWRRRGSAANWRAAIAPELVDFLLEPAQQARPRWPWLVLAGWVVAAIALAGPSWEKLPQPVLQKRDGVVIALDLSLSMYAEDVKPSRLERARFKIMDILRRRREGLTGLVVYSGDAHVVSPLTDDVATIENLVPALAPAIMPSFGSNAVAAIEQSLQLLRNAGFERGRIVLLSDEIAEDDIDRIGALIDGKKWQLSVIGVGTEQGAPIPLPPEASQGGFLKQADGTIAVVKLHRDRFARLSQRAKVRYRDIRVDDADIDDVLPTRDTLADEHMRVLERSFDQWRERGPQLVMLLLPLAALAFRRGWLLALLLMPFAMPTQAWEWRDLWLRPDQQAAQDFHRGDSKAAAQKFADPQWRSAAQYRAGDFSAAAQSLQNIDNADAHYNRGNAFARSGKLAEALAAYDAALEKNPAHADASANREIVEKLLQQQNQRSQNSQQSQPQNGDGSQHSQNAAQSQQANAEPQNSPSAQAGAGQSATQPDTHHSGNRPTDATDGRTAEQREAAPQNNPNERGKSAADQADRPAEQTDAQTSPQAPAGSPPMSAEQQRQQRATEQWLRQIPDDPSGLLRRKFLYESQQREQLPSRDEKPLW